MRAKILAATAVGLALAAVVASSALAAKGAGPGATPAVVDNFRLVDNTGFAQELKRLVDVKAIVLVSQLNGDKGSRRAAHALEALQAANPDVSFMMLNSSDKDGRAQIASEAKSQGYTIPILDDDMQLVGEQLGVSYAGEAFVIEPKTLKVLYHGPIDQTDAKSKAKGYLAEALAQVKAGQPIAVSEVQGKGAAIAFVERGRDVQHAQISYAKDVAPILEAKCVTCHQEGGIGPFAMKDYTTVKGFAPMMRESIRTGQMPPWHADREVGTFDHDLGLSRDETKTLVHWIEAGAPRGEGDDPLAAVQHQAPEWPLGKPDLIIDAPAFTIPASGVVQYQYPSVVNPLTEGRWVRAAALMPGDRRGVHHILAGYISGPPRPGPASAAQWEASYGEYAVGGDAFIMPANTGIFLPPGGSMGFQFHYTPYGKEAVDHSKIGFYFYPKDHEPEKVLHHFVIANNLIQLPPNTPEHKEVAYTKFPKDALLYSVFLHTHYRGESGRLDMVLADGTTKPLINLPRYDFNWQRTYEFKQPVLVPAGAKLVATYLYDNSVRNPANPDPAKTISWGDQSWEEMHYTSIYYQWTDETVAKPNDASQALKDFRLMGMLDANLDGKIQKSETQNRGLIPIADRFDQLDVNKDGVLDEKELAPLLTMMNRGRPGVGAGNGATGGVDTP